MYRKTTLENGLRVVTESMAEARTLSIGIVIEASPRDEHPDQAGLAHLTEHALFQGTSSRDALQIARLMDTAGGHMGAFTTRDYTCYHATVLDEYRTYALDLFGDLLLNSTFPAPNLEREKQSILREIDAYRDAPRSRLDALLKALAWPTHPLGRPIAGRPETVSALTREDVIYFMHEHYPPNRIIIAAAGNVEHADFVAHVRDAFWRLLGQTSAAPTYAAEPEPAVGCEAAPVNQAYFALGIPALHFTHGERYSLHVLNALIGGGISSRLFRRIRERHGLVYDIGSEYQAFRDNGLLVVEGSTSPEHLLPVLKMTLEVLQGLAQGDDPAEDDEIWKAKMQLRGQHSIAGESTHTRMSRLAVQELYFGRHMGSDEVLSQIEAVDGEVLGRLGQRWLAKALDATTVAVVGPESPQQYSNELIEHLLAAQISRNPVVSPGKSAQGEPRSRGPALHVLKK